MTEQEAADFIKWLNFCGLCTTGSCKECPRKQSKDTAIDALEEIQKYRAIGTLEEIKRMQKYSALAKKHDTIGKVIESCAEYEEIGTVDECREAREKQIAKKPYWRKEEDEDVCTEGYACPRCDMGVVDANGIRDTYCNHCGQALDWGE